MDSSGMVVDENEVAPNLLALLVGVRDEPGSLYRVSEAIYRHGGNVTYVSTITGGEIQFEMVGVDDREQLIADLLALKPAVVAVSEVPSFQEIFGKRVIVIGGGAQVGQVAQGAVAEADRHNIRGERISVDTIALVGEDKIAAAVRATGRLHRAKILVLAGALMGGDITTAVREVRAAGILVISTNMAGSVPDAVDLVVTDSLEAGIMAVMLVADTAKFSIDMVRGRRF
jgi:energy-converting hydrogenase B subunit Q